MTTMYVSVKELLPLHMKWSVGEIVFTPDECKTKAKKESCSVRGGACAYTKIEVSND